MQWRRTRTQNKEASGLSLEFRFFLLNSLQGHTNSEKMCKSPDCWPGVSVEEPWNGEAHHACFILHWEKSNVDWNICTFSTSHIFQPVQPWNEFPKKNLLNSRPKCLYSLCVSTAQHWKTEKGQFLRHTLVSVKYWFSMTAKLINNFHFLKVPFSLEVLTTKCIYVIKSKCRPVYYA